MMGRWGLEGMESFENIRVAQKDAASGPEELKQHSETVS